MSKVALIGVVSAGGAGAVGVGGYALFGNGFGFGGGSDNPVKPAINTDTSDRVQTPVQPDTPVAQQKITQVVEMSGGTATYEDKLEKLDVLSDAVKGGECFTNAFGSDLSFESNTSSSTIEWSNVDFGSPITPPSNDESKKYTGCARVQARKVTFSSDGSEKYTGTFSWAWAFKGTQKGLAFFGVAKIDDAQKNLDIEGVVYVLEKSTGDDSSETWKVINKQTSGKKTVTAGGGGGKLPTPSAHLSGNFEDCNYGKWLNDHQLGNIAGADATGGKQESVAHTMRWSYDSGGSTSKVHEGSINLNGGDHLFPNTSSGLTTKLDNWAGNG